MILIFAFFLVLAKAQDFQGSLAFHLLQLGMAVEAKCLKHVEPSEFANIMNSFENISKCYPQDNDVTPDTFCKDYEKVHEPCLKEVMYKMKKCLDSDEQYFPDFALEGQKRTIERMCAEGDIIERVNALTNITCQTGNIGKILGKELNLRCVPHLKIINNLEKNMISLNREDVCSDLQLFRDCIVGALDKKCSLPKDSRNVILNIFRDQLKSCFVTNGSTSTAYGAINNFVYIILGIATWIVYKRY
uniref:Uncharacterized protein n=2 Tax=Photinus pyralis TaxID=7054 RepID=A0A1Y1LTK5_PHOPY